MAIIKSAFLLLVVVVASTFAQKKPIDIHEAIQRIKDCYDKDTTKFDGCLLEFWKEGRELIVAGFSEYKIPKLDPLFIDKIDVADKGALVEGKAVFNNVTVKGIGNYVPNRVETNLREQTLTIELEIPLLDITGDYDIDGTALLLEVKGVGPFWLKVTGVEGKAVAHIVRDEDRAKLESLDVEFKVQNLTGRLENLLGGEEVGESVNRLLNDNAQDILQDVKPVVTGRIADGITKVITAAVSQLPPEAFILPAGLELPEGVTLPPGITAPPKSS